MSHLPWLGRQGAHQRHGCLSCPGLLCSTLGLPGAQWPPCYPGPASCTDKSDPAQLIKVSHKLKLKSPSGLMGHRHCGSRRFLAATWATGCRRNLHPHKGTMHIRTPTPISLHPSEPGSLQSTDAQEHGSVFRTQVAG